MRSDKRNLQATKQYSPHRLDPTRNQKTLPYLSWNIAVAPERSTGISPASDTKEPGQPVPGSPSSKHTETHVSVEFPADEPASVPPAAPQSSQELEAQKTPRPAAERRRCISRYPLKRHPGMGETVPSRKSRGKVTFAVRAWFPVRLATRFSQLDHSRSSFPTSKAQNCRRSLKRQNQGRDEIVVVSFG